MLEVEFNFSEEYDSQEDILNPADASLRIVNSFDGRQTIQVKACGRFVTLDITHGHIKVIECSSEFILESLKL